MVERFIEEIRRREKVVRIFPNMQAAWRLIGALCAEQHEEWAHGRRYLTMEACFPERISVIISSRTLLISSEGSKFFLVGVVLVWVVVC